MEIRILSAPEDLKPYDRWVKTHPQGNLWQSLERREYCEALGKEVRIYAAMHEDRFLATAQAVIDRTSFGLSAWDIPHGPLWEEKSEKDAQALMQRILGDARAARALRLFYSPHSSLPPDGWAPQPSRRLVYARATRIIDLQPPEPEILAQMHEKGRYNIKVAQKHGVEIKQSDDIDAWYRLVTETAGRDGFRHPSKEQDRLFLEKLPGSYLMLAYAKDAPKPIAGLLGVIWNSQGIYYYGASAYEYRNLMAPYLLQWESMQHCKARGCRSYDLLGIAPPDAGSSHPWQGISAFKAKFGGTIIISAPEQQVTLRPLTQKLLEWKRKFM